MKKPVILIALFAILLSGCNGQEQSDQEKMEQDETITPAVEENIEPSEIEAGSESSELEEILNDIEIEQTERDYLREQEQAAENEQIQKDMDLLGTFNGEPTKSDCDKLTHPDVKLACEELLEE